MLSKLSYYSILYYTQFHQQLGAGVARGAHNPEVAGSKPAVAIVIFVHFFSYKYATSSRTTCVMRYRNGVLDTDDFSGIWRAWQDSVLRSTHSWVWRHWVFSSSSWVVEKYWSSETVFTVSLCSLGAKMLVVCYPYVPHASSFTVYCSVQSRF